MRKLVILELLFAQANSQGIFEFNVRISAWSFIRHFFKMHGGNEYSVVIISCETPGKLENVTQTVFKPG